MIAALTKAVRLKASQTSFMVVSPTVPDIRESKPRRAGKQTERRAASGSGCSMRKRAPGGDHRVSIASGQAIVTGIGGDGRRLASWRRHRARSLKAMDCTAHSSCKQRSTHLASKLGWAERHTYCFEAACVSPLCVRASDYTVSMSGAVIRVPVSRSMAVLTTRAINKEINYKAYCASAGSRPPLLHC